MIEWVRVRVEIQIYSDLLELQLKNASFLLYFLLSYVINHKEFYEF